VGWIESEVIEWLEQRIRMRQDPKRPATRAAKWRRHSTVNWSSEHQ